MLPNGVVAAHSQHDIDVSLPALQRCFEDPEADTEGSSANKRLLEVMETARSAWKMKVWLLVGDQAVDTRSSRYTGRREDYCNERDGCPVLTRRWPCCAQIQANPAIVGSVKNVNYDKLGEAERRILDQESVGPGSGSNAGNSSSNVPNTGSNSGPPSGQAASNGSGGRPSSRSDSMRDPR